MLPGRPIAMMMFKTWGYITMAQALTFSSDMKLGHYMKVPPRVMFSGQVVATALAGTVQLGVQSWMFSNIEGICDTNAFFTCPSTEVFGTASIIWGVIGPQRQFAKGNTYYALVYFFLIGAFCPVIAWSISRKYPNRCVVSRTRVLAQELSSRAASSSTSTSRSSFPALALSRPRRPSTMCRGPSLPLSSVRVLCLLVVLPVDSVSEYVIRRRHFSWWTKVRSESSHVCASSHRWFSTTTSCRRRWTLVLPSRPSSSSSSFNIRPTEASALLQFRLGGETTCLRTRPTASGRR
jgi:hypothetical protein